MPRKRTNLERAAGKLISAIQHEWTAEAGEPQEDLSEEVMNTAHLLLQAAKNGTLRSLLGERTISNFLGVQWVHEHARVWPYIQALEAVLLAENP